jgi:PhnB protein
VSERPAYVGGGPRTAIPYLTTHDAAALVEFLIAAFGGELVYRHDRSRGVIGNAQVRFGDSRVMLSDVAPGWPAWPTRVYLYVPDVGAAYQNALELGATSLMEPQDEEYGDRAAGVLDPQGNQWWLATAIAYLGRST